MALILALLFVPISHEAGAFDAPISERKVDAKRCSPTVIRKGSFKPQHIRFRKGEKPTGFSPVIAFEILDSGEVTNARLKRSSGISDIDSAALNWAKSTRYNKRPGCGVIQSDSVVTVDFF